MRTSDLFRNVVVVVILGICHLAHAQFSLLHEFTGAANDGATPWWGSSLIVTDTTLYGVTPNGGTSSNGVLFKIGTTGSGFQPLHVFNGYSLVNNAGGSKNDGAVPYGALVLSGSILYGTSSQGGSNGLGTVFSISTSGGGFQVLHHFGGSNDGTLPAGTLVLDGSTLYGLTQNGGSNSSIGVLFKIETNGTAYQILRHFTVANNGPVALYGAPLVSAGTIYGMTRLGGTANNGAIWSADTAGSNFQVLHNFTGVATDGSHPNGSLTIDSTTLHGMTADGGSNNVGCIFQIQTNGDNFHIVHDFSLNEAYHPQSEFWRDGTTLYAFTKDGVTNIFGSNLGGGSIIKIDTDGSNYRQLHTFVFPVHDPDGQWPYGPPLLIGTKLYGMTQLGGTTFGGHMGTVFSFDLTGNGGGGGGGNGTLTGVLSKLKQKCKTKDTVTTCKFSAQFALINGTAALVPPTHIRFALSTDAAYDAGTDNVVGEATSKAIKPGKTGKLKLKTELDASATGLFLLAVDDSDNILSSALVP